jgi:alkyl hydroperoxide reductase subunit F
MSQNNFDVIIIGLGPAGMTAAIYCARKGLRTLILGKELGGQVAKTGVVENYLGFGQSTGFELTKQFDNHVESFKNIKHLHDVNVTNLLINYESTNKVKNFKIITDKKKEYKTKAVIICSGRNPKKLDISGEEKFRAKGVSYCEVCDAPIFKDKITAVIGGGNSALEAALSLATLCPKVYILNVNTNLTGDKVSQDKIKKYKNVEVINNAKIMEISGNKFVSGLKYKDLKSNIIKNLKVAGIFIEIGWEPAISFDKVTKKDKWNQIIIDKQCQTSLPGIYAAGDVTDVGYYQIIVAAGEGAKAALAAYQYLNKQK